MSKLSHGLFFLALLLPLSVGFAAAFVACDGGGAEPWRYTGFDANHSHSYPIAWRDTWTVREERRFPHPNEGRGMVLAGDVRGSAAPELLFADDRHVTVLSLAGKQIDRFAMPVVPAAPGFLFHADRDGKLDLAVGSANQAEPTFFATNGLGRSVHQYSIDETARDYRSLIPVVRSQDEIYLMTREHWVDSPRGFIRYSLESRTEAWEYRIPGNPIDLRVDDTSHSRTFLVSYTTRPTGHARVIGTAHEPADAGIDALVRLIRFDESGHTQAASLVNVRGEPLAGNAHLYPVPGMPGSALLRHDQIAYADAAGPADFVDFHLLPVTDEGEARTEAQYSHRFHAAAFVDFRLLEVDGEALLVVLLRRDGETVLELRDLEFALRGEVPVPSNATEPRLGTVLSDPSGSEAPSFFVLAGPSLLRYGADLELLDRFDSPGAKTMLVSLDEEGGTVVLVGDTVRIMSVRGDE